MTKPNRLKGSLAQAVSMGAVAAGPHSRRRGSVLDLKPYLSNVPADELRRGWLAEAEARKKD
jgi:hypothetical protein